MPEKDSPTPSRKTSGRSKAAQTGGKGSARTKGPKGGANAAGTGGSVGTAASPSRSQAPRTASNSSSGTKSPSTGSGSRSPRRDSARESAGAQGSTPSRRKTKSVYRQLRRAAIDFEIEIRGIDPVDAMQMCLDRAVELWKFAMSQVDNLEANADGDELFVDTIAGKQLHHWIQQEDRMRHEVEKLSQAMNTLDLAGRAVRAREAEVMLLITSVRDAAKDAGLTDEQTRRLGAALRERVGGTREAQLELAAGSAGGLSIDGGGQVA